MQLECNEMIGRRQVCTAHLSGGQKWVVAIEEGQNGRWIWNVESIDPKPANYAQLVQLPPEVSTWGSEALAKREIVRYIEQHATP